MGLAEQVIYYGLVYTVEIILILSQRGSYKDWMKYSTIVWKHGALSICLQLCGAKHSARHKEPAQEFYVELYSSMNIYRAPSVCQALF